MLSKGYRKKSVSPQQILFFYPIPNNDAGWERVMRKWEICGKRRKRKEKKCSIRYGWWETFQREVHLFALAHTQACYKDSEPFTIFTYRGFSFLFFFFDFSGLWCEQNKRKPLKCGRHSPINLWKQAKMFRSCAGGRTLALIERRRCGCPGRQPYTSLLCINTAKDIFHLEIWISSPNSRERRCPLSLALPLTHHNAS